MELKDLKKLSGLNECGMSPMPSTPPSPASISMTAASGSELSGMLKDIMSLAGMHKVEPAHLGAAPAPMKLLPEPVKAVGPAASDGEVMRGITDKLNLDKDDEKKADESWDNEPASPQPEEAFDANQYAHHENPPGAAKGRNFKNNPVANVEDVAEQLFADYQRFLAENVFENDFVRTQHDKRGALSQFWMDLKNVFTSKYDAKVGREPNSIAMLLPIVFHEAVGLKAPQSVNYDINYATELMQHLGLPAPETITYEQVKGGHTYLHFPKGTNIKEIVNTLNKKKAEWEKRKDRERKEKQKNNTQPNNVGEDKDGDNENLTLAMSALHSAADDLYEAGFSEEADQVLRIYHDLEEKTQSGDDELPEEKSWFDMTSAERQADYYKKGGGRPQPGHSAAPAKTTKGDIMRTAKDVKAHTKGNQDEH